MFELIFELFALDPSISYMASEACATCAYKEYRTVQILTTILRAGCTNLT